jgi:predicted esterase
MKKNLIFLCTLICCVRCVFAQAPTTHPLDPDLLSEITISFHPAVFAGDKFPDFDFTQPHLAHEILGHCKRSATFYDKEMNQVSVPTAVGRYGAVVTVTPERGAPFKRFATLFHSPQNVAWRNSDLHTSLDFPDTLGLSAATVRHQLPILNREFQWMIRDRVDAPSDFPAFFAGLSEISPDAAAEPLRDYPVERDAIWWYRLKRKTGDLVPLKYLTYLPKEYNHANDGWPLVLFLHGSGERGDDLDKVKAWGIARMGAMGKDMPFIAICPQCPAGERWLATELNDLVTDLCAKYRVDQSRIYVTGLSMGGFATWSLIEQFPDRFAAAIPICGMGDPHDVDRIKSLPIWIFHGGADPVVPVESSREMAAALRAEQGNVQYTEFPGVGHVSWEKAYATPELFPWMLAQHRPSNN